MKKRNFFRMFCCLFLLIVVLVSCADKDFNPYEFIEQYPELECDGTLKFEIYSNEENYTVMRVEYPQKAKTIKKKLDKAVAVAVKDICLSLRADSSDDEVVCAISDYLVTHAQYAHESDGVTPDTNYKSAYSLFVNKKGICDAYSDAFNILARKFGLEVISVSGDIKMQGGVEPHGWNLVKVDNEWYNVDVTWNDPSPEKKGRAIHRYTLISDNKIRAEDTESDGEEPFVLEHLVIQLFYIILGNRRFLHLTLLLQMFLIVLLSFVLFC